MVKKPNSILRLPFSPEGSLLLIQRQLWQPQQLLALKDCRGLSDAIFGLAVVYASLIMYDAQGVRREVGVHAKVLNEIIAQQSSFARTGNSSSQTTKAYPNSESNFELEGLNLEANSKQSSNMFIANKIVSTSDNTEALSDVEGGESRISVKKLKESVGHSEAEVIAGALLGFLVSLAVCTIIT